MRARGLFAAGFMLKFWMSGRDGQGGAGAVATLGGDGTAELCAVGVRGIDATLGRHGGSLGHGGMLCARSEGSAGWDDGWGAEFCKLLIWREIQVGVCVAPRVTHKADNDDFDILEIE